MTSDTYILKVPGMTCGHCVQTVERAARGAEGVEDARVDLRAKTLAVRVREPAARAAVAAAVERAGYAVES